jgi:hypothetical protein
MNKENKETRAIVGEMRTALNGDGNRMIVGYAARFNSETELSKGLYEKILPGAFDGVLDQDVRALFNHDPNIILGRTKSGTLKLSVDENGLKYEITPPDTGVARDLLESIARGDVSQSSFGFRVKEDSWTERSDGTFARSIRKVDTLYDISPVTYPAYQDTEVALRSNQNWKKNKHRSDLVAVELEILSL